MRATDQNAEVFISMVLLWLRCDMNLCPMDSVTPDYFYGNNKEIKLE